MDGWNTTFFLGRPIFRCYVSSREGMIWLASWQFRTKMKPILLLVVIGDLGWNHHLDWSQVILFIAVLTPGEVHGEWIHSTASSSFISAECDGKKGAFWEHLGVSKKTATPKWMVKIMENPIKMDDLGVPLFLQTPIWAVHLANCGANDGRKTMQNIQTWNRTRWAKMLDYSQQNQKNVVWWYCNYGSLMIVL